MKRLGLCIGLLLCLPLSSWAEVVYVTDLLRLNVYEEPKSQGSILKTLTSGDALTVLEKVPGYARVKTTDDVIGWTKSAYLVDEKPPRLVVKEMENRMEKLELTASRALKRMQSAEEEAAKFQQMLASSNERDQSLQEQVTKLQHQNSEYAESMHTYESSVPMKAYIASVILVLLLGIGIGWYFIDYLIRKRHGGFRIY